MTELCQISLDCRHIEETLGVQAGGTGGLYLREPEVLLRGVCFFQPIAVSFKAGAWHIETSFFSVFVFFWFFFFCFCFLFLDCSLKSSSRTYRHWLLEAGMPAEAISG